MKIKEVTKTAGRFVSKNSSAILTILAVSGLVTTVIFSIDATPKAMALLEENVIYDDEGNIQKPTAMEVVKITWKVFIPTACMGAATVACIIGAHSINQRRNAALATVYGLTDAAFREYKEKVAETIGKNKELKIRDDISADHVRDNPVSKSEVVITGKGEVLCRDSLSGRYFKSEIEQIRRAINDLNRDFLTDMWVSVNDLYYALGISNTKLGEEMGWDLDNGLVEVTFSTQLTESNEPCVVLNYEIQPRFMQ